MIKTFTTSLHGCKKKKKNNIKKLKIYHGIAQLNGKNPNLLIEWQRFPPSGPVRTLHICIYWAWLNHGRGGPGETNEHADRFNQRSPSGQLPLLAHWSWPELSSQTHHSMSKLPGNMSPCHSTCHTARTDGAEGDGPPDKATWSALQTGHATGPPARLRFGGHSAVSQCQLAVSVTGLTDRCLLCLWHLLPGRDENREDQLAANISRMLPEICQKSKSARCCYIRGNKTFF